MNTSEGKTKSHHFRTTFFTGIFFLVPLAITFWVLDLLVRSTERLMGPNVRRLVALFTTESISEPAVKFFSLLLVFCMVIVIGWLASFYLGKKLLSVVDMAMLRLPFVSSIYGGVKQIIDALSRQKTGGSFKKVVLLEYPRRECWVLGFVTFEELEETKQLLGERLVGIFIPSTPNPTTGFLLYCDPHEIFLLDLEVDEAIKLIVSASLVMPDIATKNQPITLAEDLGLEKNLQKA